MLEDIATCLAALYLRGIPRPAQISRRRWLRVESCLRCADCIVASAPDALRSEGFWEEAITLESTALVDSVRRLLELEALLTAAHPTYPSRWIERLDVAAPPALWKHGSMGDSPLSGIVGSRHVERPVLEFAFEVGRQSAALGYSVVSGGAAGCDSAGADGCVDAGGIAVELLPHGIDLYNREDRCGLSVCAPGELFSTAAAMERNTLIYASSEQTVIVESKFKAGGTWIGAIEATRRHLCPLIVRDDASQASKALIALGATPIVAPSQLASALDIARTQKGLFGSR